ncbi:hypothetical protein KM043_010703 [Ampulex compressa]|nr:hypothetical protein KM043_010703 [Ampulex compressa]
MIEDKESPSNPWEHLQNTFRSLAFDVAFDRTTQNPRSPSQNDSSLRRTRKGDRTGQTYSEASRNLDHIFDVALDTIDRIGLVVVDPPRGSRRKSEDPKVIQLDLFLRTFSKISSSKCCSRYKRSFFASSICIVPLDSEEGWKGSPTIARLQKFHVPGMTLDAAFDGTTRGSSSRRSGDWRLALVDEEGGTPGYSARSTRPDAFRSFFAPPFLLMADHSRSSTITELSPSRRSPS